MNGKPDSGILGGLADTARQFGESALDLLQTRLEILGLDWAEERGNLARLLLVLFCVVACLQLAIVMGLVFLFLVVSEEHRIAVLGSVALALLLAAAAGVLWLRSWLSRRQPMFGTTLSELRKDREWIQRRQ
jgi:uncharacterized membrane protein YqjE